MSRCTYCPEFNLQVFLEAVQSDRTDAEVATPYDIHPVTLPNWKNKFKEKGRARRRYLKTDQFYEWLDGQSESEAMDPPNQPTALFNLPDRQRALHNKFDFVPWGHWKVLLYHTSRARNADGLLIR